MAEVRPIEREYADAVAALDRVTDAVRAVGWLLEELRMSTFAQSVGVAGPVSVARVRRELRAALGGAT
jgi:ATP-dependent helicase HrpA